MSKKLIILGAIVVLVIIAGLYFFVWRGPTLQQQIIDANALAKNYLFSNIKKNGLFVYELNPVTEEIPQQKNNAVRQLMASRLLAQESNQYPELLDLHKVNLTLIFTFWYQEENGKGYVLYSDKSKLGANAMLLRTLIYSPLFSQYQEQAKALANGIVSLQNEDGSFRAWYIAPNYEYDEEYLLTFYSGEALVALVEYYEKTGDATWLEHATHAADFYIDKYVTHIDENYYPAYVPWHTIALNKLYKITGDEKYAEAIFTMNDKLLELQDTEQFIGRFYNPATPQYGSPHAASDAVYTEGLAYAYEVAKLVGDRTHEKTYRDALKKAVYNLRTLQYKEASPQIKIDASRYVGALREQADSFWIRVDTTQHAIDAFNKLLTVL